MFKIYALRNCDFCKRAVEELRLRSLPFFYCPLDNPIGDPSSLITIEIIKKKYNWRTVPIVVKIAGDVEDLIGGYDDLIEYLEDEKSIM